MISIPTLPSTTDTPVILSKQNHPISLELIDDSAIFVLEKLSKAGFEAYLVGGCIRDIYLGQRPKDFDIVTNAQPEEVVEIFDHCRLIGRRFKLVHIYFGREYIEVATFRGVPEGDHNSHDLKTGLIHNDNVYGSIEEDAVRRDFTINALYYNFKQATVHDFTNGLIDLKNKTIRIIGDPIKRYQEDPVRMLRAIRHSAKLNLEIDENTARPIHDLTHLLQHISPARLFEESLKLLIKGAGKKTFELLQDYNLFRYLFPLTQHCLEQNNANFSKFILCALTNTDKRIAIDKPINPAFLLATFLWQPFKEQLAIMRKTKEPHQSNFELSVAALTKVAKKQAKTLSIPKRLLMMIEQIYLIQERLIKRRSKSIFKIIEHKRFRAAYDFLLLRVEAGETSLAKIVNWWTDFQEVDNKQKKIMCAELQKNKKS